MLRTDEKKEKKSDAAIFMRRKKNVCNTLSVSLKQRSSYCIHFDNDKNVAKYSTKHIGITQLGNASSVRYRNDMCMAPMSRVHRIFCTK